MKTSSLRKTETLIKSLEVDETLGRFKFRDFVIEEITNPKTYQDCGIDESNAQELINDLKKFSQTKDEMQKIKRLVLRN